LRWTLVSSSGFFSASIVLRWAPIGVIVGGIDTGALPPRITSRATLSASRS